MKPRSTVAPKVGRGVPVEPSLPRLTGTVRPTLEPRNRSKTKSPASFEVRRGITAEPSPPRSTATVRPTRKSKKAPKAQTPEFQKPARDEHAGSADASDSKPIASGESRQPILWSQLTWEEIGRLPAAGNDAAILPIGATEQHGPHLGTGMDSSLGNSLCNAVSAATGVVTLPLLPYGCSLGHSQRWPGTLSLQPQTLISVVTEIGDWLQASGFKRLFIVNSHVTNAAPLRCALEILRSRYDDLMVAAINTGTLSPRVTEAFKADGADWHANSAETSLMLATAPELVRPDAVPRADDPDRTDGLVFAHPVNRTSKNGVTGRPSEARAEAGHQLFEWMVSDLTALIQRGRAEKPPLDASYFSLFTR